MDDATTLEVSFAVNLDQLFSASSAIDSIFAGIADTAQSSGSDISATLTAAAQSFSSISDAALEMSAMTAEGAASAVESLDSIPSASEDVSSSFTDLQGAIDSLSASVSNAVGEIDAKIETISTTAEETASKSKASFDGFDLSGMVGSVGMGIFGLQAMGNMASQTADALLGPAMAAENTESSFSNLLGGTKAASDELGKLNTFAANTQFKTQDIDNAAASMVAFKTPTANIIPELTAVGDALTAVGKGTPAEMQGVVNVLGKIGVQGHLTAGDITQLGAHGIDAMSAIEKGSGLSADALKKMISNGTLPAKDAIADLTKGIEKNPVYSGGMAKQANTLSGQMSTLGSDMDQVMASALKPALPGLEKTIGNLTNILTSPSFKQFAVTMGTDIANGVTDVVTGVTNLVDTGKNLVDFFEHNQAAMDGLEAVLGGLTIGALVFAATAIPALVIGFGAWAIGAATAAIATLAAAAPFILIGVVVGAVIFGIIEAVQHWSQITAFVGGVVKNVMGGVGNFFSGVGHTIQDIFHNIAQAAQNVGSGIEDAFKGGINGVIEGLNWLINAVDSFHVSVPPLVVGGLTVFGGVDLGLPYIPDIPKLARGGTIAPGQVAIAGEAGAELVYGGTSGASVLSHSQSASMFGGGGGGSPIIIQLHIGDQEIASFLVDPLMTKVVKKIRAQGGRMANI